MNTKQEAPVKTPKEILDDYKFFDFNEAFTDNELEHITNAMRNYQFQFGDQAERWRSGFREITGKEYWELVDKLDKPVLNKLREVGVKPLDWGQNIYNLIDKELGVVRESIMLVPLASPEGERKVLLK